VANFELGKITSDEFAVKNAIFEREGLRNWHACVLAARKGLRRWLICPRSPSVSHKIAEKGRDLDHIIEEV